jgi:RNA polymerase sigma-70 factor, ECF subfamily
MAVRFFRAAAVSTPVEIIKSRSRIQMPGKENDARAEAILGCFEALYRTAFRLAGDKAQAEDLVQETYLRAWRSLSQLRVLSGVQPWMFRILRTVFIDQVRRESKRPQLVTDVEKMLAASERLFPPEVSDVKDRRNLDEVFDQEILSAMTELPDEQRLAVLFQVVGGLSYREISEAIECPLGTVMSRIHRAKRLLRRRLAAFGKSYGIVRAIALEEEQRDAEA